MKRIIFLCLAMVLALTACDHLPSLSSNSDNSDSAGSKPTAEISVHNSDADSDGSSILDDDSSHADSDTSEPAYYDGRIGDTMSTVFFDFTVDSVSLSDQVPVSSGMMALDLVITIKNTFGVELPMFYNDFQMQYGDGDEDFCYSIVDDTIDLNMPESYTLRRGETVTYHMYFEVPETATDFALAYLEIYDDNSTGDTFFVYFERQ